MLLLVALLLAVSPSNAYTSGDKAHANGQKGIPVSRPVTLDVSQAEGQRHNEPVKGGYDPYSDRLYRAYLLATVIGVIGGITGIGIVIWQTLITRMAANAAKTSADAARDNVASLKGQLAEMKTAREQTIAEMTNARLQTEQLISQATTSANAAKQSADAVIAAERAWVMANVHWGPGEGTGRVTSEENEIRVHLLLICTNEGKTTAWVDEIRVKLEVVDRPLPAPDVGSMELISDEPKPLPAGGQLNPVEFRLNCIGKEQAGKMIVVYGVVRYRDAFSVLRMTFFGYRVMPDYKLQRISGFPEYNKHA